MSKRNVSRGNMGIDFFSKTASGTFHEEEVTARNRETPHVSEALRSLSIFLPAVSPQIAAS